MTSTAPLSVRRLIQNLAFEFADRLAKRELLERTTRLETTVFTQDDTPFSRACNTIDWPQIFGDVIQHEVSWRVDDDAVESLNLAAFDGEGRLLLTRFYRLTWDGRLALHDEIFNPRAPFRNP